MSFHEATEFRTWTKTEEGMGRKNSLLKSRFHDCTCHNITTLSRNVESKIH